ncbi:RimJ/RimL family protein N-acetyltransferase [Melghiribacillus thermohalophilus]|uniref:RimJ/RimL family protein N-acetyltransferase n=1 Tax=Melghiribacillus thermohalophilus TaxID=1324956 RepID=A0A4R3NDU8_9BACI|nr:GNAT family protein [Melghiribacillus thermohalophilus]TCT27110.1 RimJ/RimL family protein N-acetyltransferase [Melghiribacillus thermohalophilus]
MILGKSVYLRPIEKEDMKSYHQAIHNEDIRFLTGTRNTITLEQAYEYYERITSDETRHDFAICLKDQHTIIGDLTILDIDNINRKGGFRIAIHHPDYFNKGYGTEAVRLALKYSFEDLSLNRLQLEVYSHNPRGIRAYEKAGFKQEGVIRESLFLNGRYFDEIIMGILRKEYEQLYQ